jgi:hypothetical protein
MRAKPIAFAAAAVAASVLASRSGAAVIYSDNFNQPNGNFDTSSSTQMSQYGGLLGSSVWMESQKIEQQISNNQLDMQANPGSYVTGAVRFDNASVGNGQNPPNLVDWSQGTAGAAFLAAGGMQIDFDWTTPDSANDDWISVANGVGTFNTTYTVVDSKSNSGLILRDDGTTSAFTNGSATGTTPGETLAAGSNHVTIDYYFNSFANGSPVTMDTYVDGTLAATESFTWSNSSDYLELGTNVSSGELLGNFAISTVAVPEPASVAMLAICGAGLAARRRRV